MLAHARGHAFAQAVERDAHVVQGNDIVREVVMELPTLFIFTGVSSAITAAASSPRAKPESISPVLPNTAFKRGGIDGRQLADGVNAEVVQLAGGGAADEQQLVYGQRIEHRGAVFLAHHGNAVGLFQVAAELGKNAVVAHAHAHG